jgi:hypothetical protein
VPLRQENEWMWSSVTPKTSALGFQMKNHQAHITMFRFSPTLAILNLVLLAVAFIRIYSVKWRVREAEMKLLELVDDLEIR